jgi:pimeloyl-ACP methyl ester carboxylesterase
VLRATGAAQLDYVGHSMGGMVGSIFLASGGAPYVRRAVVVGSPGTFDRDAPLVELARSGLLVGGGSLLWFESGMAADAAAALGPLTPGQLQYRLYNRANMTSASERLMLRSIVSPLSRGEMQQFAHMIRDERFESADGSVTWTDRLHDVRTPVVGVAGGNDEIAAPKLVQFLVDSFGGPKSMHVVKGYGHLDLGLGERAKFDVWPLIDAGLHAQ